MRSSSEWKATTTSRPPSRSTVSAAASASRQLLELAVDEDAQRLEGARRRMDARCARRPAARGDDLGEARGARDRRFLARARSMARAMRPAFRSSPRRR